MSALDKTPGQIAYEAWGEAELKRGIATHPFWEFLTDEERASWEAAGAAVVGSLS